VIAQDKGIMMMTTWTEARVERIEISIKEAA
jgi:hypothetical protein